MAGPALERAIAMVNDMQAMAKDAVKSAVRDASGQIWVILNAEYHNSAAGWYGAYSPKKYKKRKHSIYNLMSDDSSSDMDIGWKFSDDNMTKSSTGGSLFDKVFLGGSHGLPHRSFHPVVSTPVPDLLDENMEKRRPEIESILTPYVETYFFEKLSKYSR